MPVMPIPGTPAVPRAPDAAAQERVRDRKSPRDLPDRKKRQQPARPATEPVEEGTGHIDYRA